MADQITVVGNVATAPEQRSLSNGGTVVSFRLASTQRRRDQATGEWQDGHTNWFRVSAYRTLGENVFASLRKGGRIVVTGRYRLRTWDVAGTPGHEAEIDADALGHDLRWGVSTFAAAGRGDSAPVSAGAEWAPSPGDEQPF